MHLNVNNGEASYERYEVVGIALRFKSPHKLHLLYKVSAI